MRNNRCFFSSMSTVTIGSAISYAVCKYLFSKHSIICVNHFCVTRQEKSETTPVHFFSNLKYF